jgi:hypothetical protein
MPRNSRIVQLARLAAMGIALGVVALFLFGPPRSRSTEPPREFSVPLEPEQAESKPVASSAK